MTASGDGIRFTIASILQQRISKSVTESKV
jgi:hypothetical protein